MAVEVHDTITVTTTITVDRNDKGDTLRVATVKERDKVRDRLQLKVKSSELRVVHDTVFIERRDSVFVSETDFANDAKAKGSGLKDTLKWIFFIILGLTALVITVKLCLRK